MPLHDVVKTEEERLPRLGILRLGVKKVSERSGKEYPAESPHFVLADAPEVAQAYGDEPKELMVYMPFPSVDENFPAYHELWQTGGCACRGDGRTIQKHVKKGVGRVVQDGLVRIAHQEDDGRMYQPGQAVACPGLQHTYSRCGDCRPRAVLFVMVRDPQRPMQLINDRLGYYQVSTSSLINVQTITGQLQFALGLARGMGRNLQGIPMYLRRVEKEASYFDEKEKVQKSVTKYFLELEFDARWVQVANEAMAANALGSGVDLALPSGEVEYVDSDYVTESTHWIDEKSDTEERFFSYVASEFNLSHKEVLDALQVDNIRQYKAGKLDAVEQIREYLAS